MATLIPEIFGRKLSSDAERKIAGWCRTDLHDAIVMHSVGLVRHSTKRWAEADFVLICGGGVFCLEVKGGLVRRIAGEWSFTDRHGHVATRYEGPFDQAGGAAGALQTWLAERGVRRDDGSRFQVGYAVMTPDCALDVDGPDLERELLFDQRDVEAGIGPFVDRIGAYWQRRQSYEPLSPSEMQTLNDAIRPDFEATMTRSLVHAAVGEEIVRFTEDQLEVLDGLVDNPRVMVRGSAGTGKSLLAVREARRLAAAGHSVLLVCHTRALAEVLRDAVTDPRVTTVHFHQLASETIDEAGRRHELPEASDDVLYDDLMPALAAEILAAEPHSRRFDALVVDEGQDLLKGRAVETLEHLLIDGWSSGRWRVFLDPNQNVFGKVRRPAVEALEAGSPTSYRLRRNCRNTVQIVQYSAILAGAYDLADSRVSGPEVTIDEDWATPWDRRAADAVDATLAAGTQPDDVVVLVPTRRDVDRLIGSHPGFSDRRRRGTVRVSTVAGFKGLESPVIVLAALRSLEDPVGRQLAYLGATRAQVELKVVLPETAEKSYRRRLSDYAREMAERIRRADTPA